MMIQSSSRIVAKKSLRAELKIFTFRSEQIKRFLASLIFLGFDKISLLPSSQKSRSRETRFLLKYYFVLGYLLREIAVGLFSSSFSVKKFKLPPKFFSLRHSPARLSDKPIWFSLNRRWMVSTFGTGLVL